jgi:KDO2-lipid IV(A) lauroyltransferase
MQNLLDIVAYVFMRILFWALGVLPHSLRVGFFAAIFRIAAALVPRISRTVRLNLRRSFPAASEEWIAAIARKNAIEIGRLVADTVRLSRLDEDWVRRHVSFPSFGRYLERMQSQSGKGVLIATGHLGSFELLGHAVGLMGYPLAAVARRFRSRLIDRWWTAMRESRGNRIIDRTGAFKQIVAAVNEGISVAVLFDQNVTRNHAVFVDWFGEPAATTKSVALAALRTEVPLFVASMKYVGQERYVIDLVECECSDVYGNQDASTDDKVRVITQRLSDLYCGMIAEFPEGWFWMHRRWKTRPKLDTTEGQSV